MTTSTTFFEDLFYGNIKPVDKCFDRNSEYAVLTNLIVENRGKLAAFLEALPHAEKNKSYWHNW